MGKLKGFASRHLKYIFFRKDPPRVFRFEVLEERPSGRTLFGGNPDPTPAWFGQVMNRSASLKDFKDLVLRPGPMPEVERGYPNRGCPHQVIQVFLTGESPFRVWKCSEDRQS